MNEFALCIEYLLLNHDCIVVPGLGSFIAQHQEARYDGVEETMLPPYRQVRFNAELQHEDSFILSSIQQIYDISQTEAEQKLAMWINEFTQSLEDCGSIDFGSIGVFTDDDEQLCFTPAEAGIATPEYYALDTFHIQQIPAGEAPVSHILETDPENITIRINRHIVSYIAAACVAILLFLSYSTPLSNTVPLNYGQQSASELFLPANLLLPTTTEHKQEKVILQTTSPKEEISSAQPTTTEPVIEEQHPKTESPYCIVVASAVSQKNAELYVEILKKRGYDTARVLDNGRVTRVVVGSYDSEDEAGIAVREIHRQSDEFKYAWVYHI